MKKQHYIQLITAAFALAIAVMLPDYIVGAFGVNTTDMAMWAKVITVFYALIATIIILYHYGIKARELRDPDKSKGYPYGAAFAQMMIVVIASSIPLGGLTFVLRSYVCVQAGAVVSLYGIWAASLMSIIVLGGMGALLSAAYVKRNPIIKDESISGNPSV